jgi:hypothetical protein
MFLILVAQPLAWLSPISNNLLFFFGGDKLLQASLCEEQPLISLKYNASLSRKTHPLLLILSSLFTITGIGFGTAFKDFSSGKKSEFVLPLLRLRSCIVRPLDFCYLTYQNIQTTFHLQEDVRVPGCRNITVIM